tara:strand:- start:384 stop:716 length:333 start_codon:yes stop_codon:yes gene_type:complete
MTSGITGMVGATAMISGIGTAVTEGNCIVADSLDFVDKVNQPIANISGIAQNVIRHAQTTIDSAQSLSPQLDAIATAMSSLSTALKVDTCSLTSDITGPFEILFFMRIKD